MPKSTTKHQGRVDNPPCIPANQTFQQCPCSTEILTINQNGMERVTNPFQLSSDSLRYCQENKGLQLNGYVFMLNHMHLIVTLPDVAGFLRDFNRFTFKQLHDYL